MTTQHCMQHGQSLIILWSAAEGEYTVMLMQTQTQTQGHTHAPAHLPPPVVHPLQTHCSLVHDVMLSDPSSAVSPSLRLSHTPLSLLLLILLVAPVCICWISSDSLHTPHSHTLACTHTQRYTRTHAHKHPRSLSHTLTHTLPGGFLRHCSLCSLHLAPVFRRGGESTVSPSFLL